MIVQVPTEQRISSNKRLVEEINRFAGEKKRHSQYFRAVPTNCLPLYFYVIAPLSYLLLFH